MPTYDYVCDACEHAFELFQSITAPAEKKCPKCKKQKLRRLFGTGGAIMFKGSGFYKTDYRSESYTKAAKSDSAANSGDAKDREKKGGPAKSADAASANSPSSSSESATSKADASPTSSRKKRAT